MTRSSAIVAVLLGLMMVAAPALAGQEVTVEELTTRAAELAEVEVVVEGELVGDYGFRDDGSMWTQLNGDVYATQPLREGGLASGANVGVGVRMPAEDAAGLDPPGGYRQRGPLVRVTGIWRYHDPGRRGESYLDVKSLEVVEPGRTLPERENWLTIAGGLILAVAASAIWLNRSTK